MASHPKYLFVVMMDIEPNKEEEFNEIYNNEHVPNMLEVPGMLSGARYRTSSDGAPRYLALYGLESPDVPYKDEFNQAVVGGEYARKVRPYTSNRSHIVYERIYPED